MIVAAHSAAGEFGEALVAIAAIAGFCFFMWLMMHD
jgi:hypothetical protein